MKRFCLTLTNLYLVLRFSYNWGKKTLILMLEPSIKIFLPPNLIENK
jgi:hypothetical protein